MRKVNIFSCFCFHLDSCNCVDNSLILKTFISSRMSDFCAFSHDVSFHRHLNWASGGILLREGSLNVTAKTVTSGDGAGHSSIIEYCVECGMTPGQKK